MAQKVVGIIPAAGRGTRLGMPYPKELLPIGCSLDGRIITVLGSNLIQLSNAGVNEACVVINPSKLSIKDHLGFRYADVSISYPYQIQKLSNEGLPDAIWAAEKASRGADIFVMLMGDVYFSDPDVVNLLLHSLCSDEDAIASVATWETDQPHRFGIVYSNHGNQVSSVVDKPLNMSSPQLHWGAVAFRQPFWKFIELERDTMSHALDRASEKNKILYYKAPGKYFDLGNPRALIDAIVEVNK